MTAFAPQQDVDQKLSEIEESTRIAWQKYSHLIEGLTGRDYEEVEPQAWEELQQTLETLTAERNELTAGATSSA